jgi:hypothetical protein
MTNSRHTDQHAESGRQRGYKGIRVLQQHECGGLDAERTKWTPIIEQHGIKAD